MLAESNLESTFDFDGHEMRIVDGLLAQALRHVPAAAKAEAN